MSAENSTTQTIDLNNAEFQNALRLLTYTNRSIFLTGKAGTGKSTFLRHITSVTRKRYVVLAPTGIAAVNVGGQTIHSFFKLPFKPLLPDDPDFAVKVLRKRLKYSGTHAKLIKNLDMVIIDEVSMVRADIIDFIDKVLRVYSGNMRQPFGGKQMLFVGDVFQLEPVVTGDTRDMLARFYRHPYFFAARAFNELALVPIELQKVYRQEESTFIGILDRMRQGTPRQADIDMVNSRVRPWMPLADDAVDNSGELVMTLATRRDMVDHINETRLNALPAPAVKYPGVIVDDFPTSSLPTDLELVLKVGAQVVFIKNDPERRWVNGTLASVVACDEDTVTVRLESGDEHVVYPEVWANVKYTYNEEKKTVDEDVLGTFTQLPLKAAWALTIHKSQGLTFSNVIIDFGRGAFTGGQTYVALSRCRSLEGITLRSTVSARDVYVNPAITRFSHCFNNDSIINEALNSTRADELFTEASKALGQGNTARAVEHFFEALSLRDERTNPRLMRMVRRKLGIVDAMRERIADLEATIKGQQEKLRAVADNYVTLGHDLGSESWESDAAIANFDKAIDLCPNHYDALLGKGRLLLDRGDIDAARDILARAARTDTAQCEPLILLGDLERATGDNVLAMDHYLAAHELSDNKDLRILDRLAELYQELGDDTEADRFRKAAARLRRRKK